MLRLNLPYVVFTQHFEKCGNDFKGRILCDKLLVIIACMPFVYTASVIEYYPHSYYGVVTIIYNT